VTKRLVVVSKGSELKNSALLKVTSTTRFYNGKVSAPKNNCEFPHVSRHPLRPIHDLTTSPSSPHARKPISVAIPLGLSRKKGAMMQETTVSHGKTKMDKVVRRGELPCVRCSRSLYGERVVGSAVPMSMEIKNVMKKQRRSK
jgi:hypothetical protein